MSNLVTNRIDFEIGHNPAMGTIRDVLSKFITDIPDDLEQSIRKARMRSFGYVSLPLSLDILTPEPKFMGRDDWGVNHLCALAILSSDIDYLAMFLAEMRPGVLSQNTTRNAVEFLKSYGLYAMAPSDRMAYACLNLPAELRAARSAVRTFDVEGAFGRNHWRRVNWGASEASSHALIGFTKDALVLTFETVGAAPSKWLKALGRNMLDIPLSGMSFDQGTSYMARYATGDRGGVDFAENWDPQDAEMARHFTLYATGFADEDRTVSNEAKPIGDVLFSRVI